jgi:hypothetical protein
MTMLYLTRSRDEGDTFVPYDVSDVATDPYRFTYEPSRSLGDYIGIAALGDFTYVGWGDGRNASAPPHLDYNSDIYATRLHTLDLQPPPRFQGTFRRGPRLRHLRCPPQPIDWIVYLSPVQKYIHPVQVEVQGLPSWMTYELKPDSGVPPFETTLSMTFKKPAEGKYQVVLIAHYNQDVVTVPVDLEFTSTPFVLLGVTIADPGDKVPLEAQGFTPASTYEVSLDGKVVVKGTVGDDSVVAGTLAIPRSLSDGKHLIVVRDAKAVEASATLITPALDPESGDEEMNPRPFRRGDANASGTVDLSDAVCSLFFLFGPDKDPCADLVPRCLDAADANDDGKLDVSDPVTLLSHLFITGAPLPAPFGTCGADPDTGGGTLGCEEFAPCE